MKEPKYKSGGATERLPILRLLADTRETLINEAVQAKSRSREFEKQQLTNRRIVIDHFIRKFEKFATGRALPKRVFIAHSERNGTEHKMQLAQMLTNEGFDVVTGFDDAPTVQENVLKKVLKHLNSVSVFLGILTPDDLADSANRIYAPSVWVTEEKGMALALELPYVLVIDDRVGAQYWQKTVPGQEHYIYNSTNKDEIFGKAVRAVVQKWQMRRDSFLEAPAY